MPRTFVERFFSWIKRNERWLSSLFFIFGFIDHIATFGILPLRIELWIFEAYVGFAALCTLVTHITSERQGNRIVRAIAILSPLLAQLTIGGVLAGFVVFYTKSSVLSISWPFLLLLMIVFVGNELFRSYREHLVFQTVLLYFSLYALAIFALPVYVGKLGPLIFTFSTLATIGIFALFLSVLAFLGWSRLKRTLRPIILSTSVLTLVLCVAYGANFIPPLPLALKSGGIYQEIVRQDGAYTAQGEPGKHWWDPRSQIITHVPGTPLYAYSAIFAPAAFSSEVVHVWQYYDENSRAWVTKSTVAFVLSGGREEGYRGYSIKADPIPGKWRVLVQTIDGQTIGQYRFDVENVSIQQPLITEFL